MFQEKAMHYKEKKRSKALVFLLAVDVCICICILLAAWAVFLKQPQAVALAPDVAPAEVEQNQTPLESSDVGGSSSENVSADSDVEDGAGRVSISFSDQVVISLADKTAALYFGSGERSLVNIVLQIVVQDHVLAQSATITPNNKVERLSLIEGAEGLLDKGSYEGQFKLYYYEPETGKKLTVDSVIPVTVSLQ